MIAQSIDQKKMKKGKNDKIFNTETMLMISEIRGDTIILKDGGLRSIVKIYGLNLDLKNFDEQQIVIEQYKKFLNGLDFPIQILVRSAYLDLTDYIEYVKEKINKIDNEVLKWQGQQYSKFLDEINAKQGLIYTKEFYIVIPFYANDSDMANVRKPWRKKLLDSLESSDSPEKIVARYREFLKNRNMIDTRTTLIMEGLKGFGIMSERLGLADIISLIFRVYNPNSHKALS